MNWYLKKILISGSVEEYLQSLGATPEIIQFILSQGANSQILVNEFRKNPAITIEQLQGLIPQPQEQIDPYTSHEYQIAQPYPEPMRTWILVNLKKLRSKEEWTQTTKSEKIKINNFRDRWIDYCPQMLDWVEKSDPPPDISSYSPERAIQASDEWHRMMASRGEGVIYEPTQPDLIIYGPEWQNPEWKGWTVQKVKSENDLLAEGNRMDHCVGSFYENVESGKSTIFSLRDPRNNPHITIETGGENDYNPGTIEQIQGKSNSEPKDIYKAMIKEWISNSKEQDGIQKEINTFENMEETNPWDWGSVEDLTGALEKILQGESNEYGLTYILDQDFVTIMDNLVTIGEVENSRHYNDSQYYGDIAAAPSYVTNLALMQDLNLPSWPKHSGEWEELRKMPKESEWKNIQEIEQWAQKTINDVSEDFFSYETGLEYPQEEDFEDPKEYEVAMNKHDEDESEIHSEWLKNSVNGGFAKDLLDEINSFRKQGIVPSSQELYDIKKKKQEQKLINSPAYQEAYSRGQQMGGQAIAHGKNWFKKAQQKMIGYKVMRGENGVLISGSNSRIALPMQTGVIHSMPGQGIFLGITPEYVTDYYFSGGEDPDDPKEYLITYEFDPSQITFGNLKDREWEISVPSAKVIDIKPLN